MTWRS